MPSVLLIDDHAIVLDALSYVLEDQGFSVITSNSGQGGLTLARQHKPDVIITDYHMPGMDGMAVLKEIRNNPEFVNTPVVILTLEEGKEIRERFLNNGASAFMTKSQKADEMIQTLHQLL